MNDKYEEFSTDLFALWQAGYKYIPRVADAYADASRELSSVDGLEHPAFAREAGGSSKVAKKFIELRDYLQIMTGRVSENLYAVGETLVATADAYAENDANNAEKIDYTAQKEASADSDPAKGFDKYGQPTNLDDAVEVDGADDLLPDDKGREEEQEREQEGSEDGD